MYLTYDAIRTGVIRRYLRKYTTGWLLSSREKKEYTIKSVKSGVFTLEGKESMSYCAWCIKRRIFQM